MAVLFFSPNERTLSAFIEILEGASIPVCAVGDASEALSLLGRDRFEVVVADDDYIGNEGERFLEAALESGLLRGNAILITGREPEPIGRGWRVVRAPLDAEALVRVVSAALVPSSATHARHAVLALYVSESAASMSALENVQKWLAGCDPERVRLTVFDIGSDAGLRAARLDHVHFTPTLVLQHPARAWLIGLFDDPKPLHALLELAGVRGGNNKPEVRQRA